MRTVQSEGKSGVPGAPADAAVRRLRRLGTSLTVGLGLILGAWGSEAGAGVVAIDVSAISGTNGGLSSGSYTYLNNFTPAGGNLFLQNNRFSTTGLSLQSAGGFGIGVADGSNASANPKQFQAGDLISSASLTFFEGGSADPAFRFASFVSADFGPGSFLGFKDGLGRYGYIEVTWTAATSTFQILSAAYESVAGVAIETPRAAAVPEPSTLGLMALGAAGLVAARRFRAERSAS